MYYRSDTFLLHKINKPTVVEIGATILTFSSLIALVRIPMSKNHPCFIYTKHYSIINPLGPVGATQTPKNRIFYKKL